MWSFLFFYSPVVLCFILPLPPYILFIIIYITLFKKEKYNAYFG